MLELTFGEQVKVILKRKGMTIKELAELIEERTGKKMSRQNLTQRLSRDNFQEQDMRMIAGILECPFQLDILGESAPARLVKKTEEKLATKEKSISEEQLIPEKERIPQEIQVEAGEIQQQEETLLYRNPGENERDITIGELLKINEELDEMEAKESQEKPAEEKVRGWRAYLQRHRKNAGEKSSDKNRSKEAVAAEPEPIKDKDTEKSYADENYVDETPVEESYTEEAYADEFYEEGTDSLGIPEDNEIGDINPYTGREYESNSVRMHPKRIGYVQVYDRVDHKWTDMTEWAFLGYQERKKALLGKDYEEPIYLD